LGLKSLSEGLKHIFSLQDLNLDFSYCQQIKKEGLQNFGEALKNLSSLKYLALSIPGYKRDLKF